MSVPRPWRVREPACIHTRGGPCQPASACRICVDGPELARWKAEWAAWAAENPQEAERLHQWVRAL